MWPKKRRSVKLTATSNTSIPPSVSAVEVGGNIDITTEILLRLPVKSLIRFKAVSKLWLSLISDPKFSRLHHSHSASASASGLFLKSSNHEYNSIDLNTHPSTPPFKSLAFGSERSTHRIFQSSNGLLLCCNSYHPDVSRRSIYVSNPATKHYTTLPQLPRHTRADFIRLTIFGVGLAFDPSRSAHYKVVCVRNFTNGDATRFQIDIYSSETGPWRPSRAGFFEAGYETLFDRGVFWNGCLHWNNPWGDSLRFDVDAERVHQMPMPPVPHSLAGIDRSSGYFGESGDFLHFVDHLLEPGESRFKVYEMERAYSGWSVKYIVDVSEISRTFPEIILGADSDDNNNNNVQTEYLLSVLCVVRCEVEEESFLVMHIPGRVLRYKFENRVFCKLCDVPIDDSPEMVLKPFEAHQYIASLACV